MTARVCPVHGEYAADGVCRWCEEPIGADQSTITLPLGCICQKCLRMFDAPIPLTSLLCPECRGKAQPTSTDVVGESPGARALLDVKHIAGILGDPHPRWDPAPTFTYAGEDAIAVHWILDFTPAICPEDLMAAFDAEVAAQHAALRWERVARRWNWKHRVAGGLNERERAYVWRAWVEQQERQRQARLIEAGIPKEWP